MVRSMWKKTLVTSLAWASLALAQQPLTPAQPSPAVPAGMPERTLTVQEPGKPAQRCAILKTWKTPEGTTAYQVKALATGEMMTIVESGPVTSVPGRQPGSRLQAITTRIFHWGQWPLPPTGTPLPPADMVQTTPAPVMRQEVITEVQQPRQRFLPRLFNRNREESFPVETRPYTPLPASAYAPADGSLPTTITSLSTPASPVTLPAVPARTPVVLPPASGNEQGRIDMPRPQATPAATAPSLATTPAEPSDWRRSWGKADDHRSRLIPRILPVRDRDENKDVNSESKLPTNQSKQPDPLQDPDQYTSDNLDKKYAAGKADAVLRKEEQPRAGFLSWLATQRVDSSNKAAQPAQPAPVSQTTTQVAWTDNPSYPQTTEPVPTATEAANNQRIPLGAGSILAASEAAGGSARYVPVPVIGIPAVDPQPAAPPPNIPQPPQIYDLPRPPQIYAGPGYANGPMVYRALGQTPTTNDPGVANAFVGLPTREMVAQASNAFSPGPQAGMAAPQPAMTMYPPNPYGQMVQQVPATQTVMPLSQPVIAAGYQAPVSASPAGPKGQSLPELMQVLHDSLYPSQREQAAEKMCTYDWRLNQQVATALVMAAQDDPAPTVRMQCVHCLAKMRVNTPAAMKAIRSLRSDPDGRVRQEAAQAEVVLGSYSH